MKYTKYLLVLLCGQAFGQIDLPLFSEPASLSQQVCNTLFTIKYERPKTNDRKIYGGLVPYNEVWRTGSSECTKISFDTDVYINKQKIDAGKYSLFTIPSENEWTIILNKDTTLYGSYKYSEGLDVLRFKSSPVQTDHWAEAFSITMDVVHDKARVHLHWGEVLVSFEIETNAYDNLRKQILHVLEKDLQIEESMYANAADYIIHNRSGFGEDYLTLAEQLIILAFKKEPKSGFNYRVRRDILKLQNNREEYMRVSLEEIDFLETEKPFEGWEYSISEVKKEMENFGKK